VTDEAILYAIPGSHACKTGELMLAHKGIPYRRVDFIPGMHSMRVRMKGFPGKGEERRLGGAEPTAGLALGDRLGTVPAIRIGDEHLQVNRKIARRLDELQPDPPLFPADPELRAEVEEAERWGDDPFQMVARRLTLAGGIHGPDFMYRRAGTGPLGPLLFHNDTVRRIGTRGMSRFLFRVDPESEGRMLAELPAMLDRIDAWIAAGVLNGETLNAADYMILTSLAMLWYREDLGPEIESRPLGELVARALPVPARA
jgi:glutathione S-transferase